MGKLQDKRLVRQCGSGSAAALQSIYDKYKKDMLKLGFVLCNDRTAAQDAVHDVFVAFARRASTLHLRTSLKAYLLTCVANRLRNLGRRQLRTFAQLDHLDCPALVDGGPAQLAMRAEQAGRIESAMDQLPFEQREVVMLHIHAGMKFREIAEASGVSLSTIQSRYNYGLNKLRSALDGEVEG